MISSNPAIRQYAIVTGNYWAFTLTDGALRMLVVLHFQQIGYSPLQIAALFLFYEVFGVITNLFGGYLGARIGLNRTMNIGLAMQVIALLILAVPTQWLSVPLVMGAQALSGIAKDLNKMSAKSCIKSLVSATQQGQLFKWVALLTGSKNALKGVGFFLGGTLLALIGFKSSVLVMAGVLGFIWLASLFFLQQDLGKAKSKPKFSEIFSKSRAVNILSAARFFLFGARDIWFVVALPVFLSSQLGWDFWWIGGFLAAWVIFYGLVQSLAPNIIQFKQNIAHNKSTASIACIWALALTLVTAIIALLLVMGLPTTLTLVVGLFIFGAVFAVNSSLHSYLIVSYAKEDGASMDIGFYYMANALGRLIGTILSGWVYQQAGLTMCLWVSTFFVALAAMLSIGLPKQAKALL